MKMNVLKLAVVGAIGVFSLAGCGGGGSSSSQANSKTVSGVITHVQSGNAPAKVSGLSVRAAGDVVVTINNLDYTIESDDSVTMDDAPADAGQLAVGMVVTLETDSNGNVAAVSFADEVQGYVLAKSLVSGVGTLNVMGQVVNVTATTTFESDVQAITSIDQVMEGVTIVEVSGYSDGNGNVFATRVEVKNADEDIEVKGTVSSLGNTTFLLGAGLLVDFSSASEKPGNLANGLYVEVKADAVPTPNGDGTYTLVATKVEVEDDGDIGMEGEEGEDVELQGVISFDGETVLLNGQPVGFGADSGLSAASFTAGQLVKVEGRIEGGALIIEEMEIESDD